MDRLIMNLGVTVAGLVDTAPSNARKDRVRLSPRWVGCLMMSVLIGAVAACDPMIGAGISVAPAPGVGSFTLERNVLSTTASVARRNGMTRLDDITNVEDAGWLECYQRGGVHLCAKSEGATTQLLLTDFPSRRFPAWADSLRRELLDSLRARFDSAHVRECKLGTNGLVCAEARPVQTAPTRQST